MVTFVIVWVIGKIEQENIFRSRSQARLLGNQFLATEIVLAMGDADDRPAMMGEGLLERPAKQSIIIRVGDDHQKVVHTCHVNIGRQSESRGKGPAQ